MSGSVKVDCFGLMVSRAKLNEVHNNFYWGGGVYGDPAGPECDFNKALARFSLLGFRGAEVMASEFTNADIVPVEQRNAAGFKAYLNLRRKCRPDLYDRPALVRIVARCPQLELQAETGGRDTGYGLWFATLSIMKFSDGGDDEAAIEELTGQHRDYCPKVASSKMHDINAPHRCETFADYAPTICEGCRFNGVINSPIALGFTHEPRGRVAT